MVYPGAVHSSQIKAEETWIIESFCTETNPSPFFPLTYTLAQMRMLRKTKRKRQEDMREKFTQTDFSVWSHCTWHRVSCDFTPPVNCLSLIKSAQSPKATNRGNSPRRRSSSEILFKLFTPLFSFPHQLLSILFSMTTTSSAPQLFCAGRLFFFFVLTNYLNAFSPLLCLLLKWFDRDCEVDLTLSPSLVCLPHLTYSTDPDAPGPDVSSQPLEQGDHWNDETTNSVSAFSTSNMKTVNRESKN